MHFCPRCSSAYADAARFCPVDGEVLRESRAGRRGDVLGGQFRLLDAAGQGASGTVYRAWQSGVEREVAVKVLHRELVADKDMVLRFGREARAIARLHHPNIVHVLSVGDTEDGVPFLAMELVEGSSLEAALATGAMPPPRAIAIARQVVAALGCAHDAGVVHRDLKPANVFLVERRRGAEQVKVLDFGVAKILAAAGDGGVTQEGAVLGTPQYIAPEQASGEEVDGRADLYSVGVMLYRMVTGRLPFEGGGLAVMLAHVSRPVTPPAELVPGLDPALSRLIVRCLAKRPADRYRSAHDLADALDAIAGVDAAPWATRVHPVRPRAPARRAERLLALLAGVAIGLGAAASAGRLAQVSADRAASEPAPPSSDAGLRAVVVAEAGYSMRVLIPERLQVGIEYPIEVEVWDRHGEPLVTPELVVTIEEPAGIGRGVVARATGDAGRFRLRRAFEGGGEHILRVFPPTGDATIQVFFEVVAAAESPSPQTGPAVL